MKKDNEIQKDVMEALKWSPLLRINQIGVSVEKGIVTLSGIVDSYPKKIEAERIVQKVNGVKGIAEDIIVHLKDADKKTDNEIAQAVLHELKWHSNLNADNIKIHVEDGIVTLEGIVDWDFQRKSVSKTISNLRGVQKIHNNIILTRVAPSSDLKDKIKEALKRYSNLQANNVEVDVFGHDVVLSGSVNTWEERNIAERIVWSAPGVTNIKNNLECLEEEFI